MGVFHGNETDFDAELCNTCRESRVVKANNGFVPGVSSFQFLIKVVELTEYDYEELNLNFHHSGKGVDMRLRKLSQF